MAVSADVLGRSWTLMPWRSASRPTTNRPMRRATETSTTGGLASRQLTWASSSGVMPMPLSVTETISRRRRCGCWR